MKQIPLTQGKFAMVDDDDFERLNQKKWHAFKNHNGDFYAARAERQVNGTYKTVYMHCEILGVPSGMQCDHKSRNTLDNTRANLRPCTPAENARNRKNQTGSRSAYKGVSSFRNKWKSEITFSGRRFYLGLYASEEEAAMAYNQKALELFGEFASPNIIKSTPV